MILRHGQNVTNVSYLYNKSACIYTLCLAVSELIVGQGSRHNACVMDMIWDELRSNNIEIDRETLSFHIDACLREHEDIYGAVINQMDKDNLPTNLPNSLCDIYEEMCPNNVGRLIAYLSLVSTVHEFKEVMVSGIFSRVLNALQFLF